MKKDLGNNSFIEADDIQIGDNVQWGKDIDIKVRGKFSIGKNSYVGDRFSINAEEVEIGDYFFNEPTDSRGMVIGGDSSNFPFAKLKIGDRCTCHTGHINLARAVEIGNDVGLSHDVDIITHGFWASILEGYPSIFDAVKIGNNVTVGWKSIIMAGVKICDDVVIGSHATVVKSLTQKKGLYVGSPAKLIKTIRKPSYSDKVQMMNKILYEFNQLMSYYKVPNYNLSFNYPDFELNDLKINAEELTCTGKQDLITDAFRDFLRRYGIKVFTERPFSFKLERK